ncbi:MAG TPA: right-handed parallel beta-helix repeat-containing protein, partial [Longimicrobium sp.]|nr:right-handed parallel beta-helix repeat-containing protein [Longimicrobium sp.]
MTQSATTLANLASLTASAGDAAYLTQEGREGMFVRSTSNLSTEVLADSLKGIYVPPSSDTSGASGAWVRVPEEPCVLQLDWFGANGDGVTSDTVILVTVIDTIRSLRRLGVNFHTLRFSGCKTYYLEDLSTHGPALLDFSDFTAEGNGAELKLEPLQSNTSVFDIGNDGYETGVDETMPENITIRGFNVDLVQNGPFLRFCNLRYPARKVLIERNHGYQSLYGDATPQAALGDAWFISINAAGLPSDAVNPAVAAADKNARVHEVTIRDNVVRHQMQLTGNGGRGVDGLTIVGNEVYDPRANGISLAGVGRISRLENVLIAHNKVYRAEGRGIYIQNDNIGDAMPMYIAQMQTYQSYVRNVVICDNLLEDCKQGIRTGTDIQGFHGLVIDNNVVRSTSPDNNSCAIRIQSNAYRWAAEYWGGSDPVIDAASFDAANDRVTFTVASVVT